MGEGGGPKSFYKDIPPVRSNFLRVLMEQRRNNAAAGDGALSLRQIMFTIVSYFMLIINGFIILEGDQKGICNF